MEILHTVNTMGVRSTLLLILIRVIVHRDGPGKEKEMNACLWATMQLHLTLTDQAAGIISPLAPAEILVSKQLLICNV